MNPLPQKPSHVSDTTTPAAPTGPTPNDFASFYLYGLTTTPYQQSTDFDKFGELYKLVVGAHGGFSIASSFHPYQLLNPAGVSVWYTAFAQFYAQPSRIEMFGEMTLEKTSFLVVPPASFAEYNVWPDVRLTHAENPIFSRYVPFVIPFLVRKAPAALRWDAEVAAAGTDRERLSWYLEAVKDAMQFLQPAPALLLGFGEFDEQHPEQLIEKFMNCRDLLR
ncbi:hypothetical protein BEN47_13040 [Hymenobacter lapidarius]|uniref:Uncharacterized protein n=1 Tax=Hymenobacter lapidarius TaxID=1908237 RepID=A0A1G1T6D4_9BACT|nr:hypothetical protein BEN47_13040 [Hymenobacter lapidarius]